MIPRTVVFACVLALLPHRTLIAQTTVGGVVRDSLSGRPFAGATVQLVSVATPWDAGRTVKSDSAGRFTIPDVTPGRYVFGFVHPRLDSLGLDAVSRTLDVSAKRLTLTADLALPSGGALAASLCGTRTDSTGVLLGRVFDAADETAPRHPTVRVRWAEFAFDGGGIHRAEGVLTIDAGRDGRYVACGVPMDIPVLVSAVAGDSASRAASGEIELALSHELPLIHRDLLVSGQADEERPSLIAQDSASAATALVAPRVNAGMARLSGHVFTPEGRVLTNARVSIADVEVVSDSAGKYRFANLPAGTQQITVIAIGFAPTPVAVDLRPDREAIVDLSVRARVSTLDVRTVFADRGTDHAGFYRRRDSYSGVFMTAADIERKGAFSVREALINVRALRYVMIDPLTGKPVVGGRFNCTPAIYLDGFRSSLDDIDSMLGIRQIGGIEVYANPSEAPPQFAGPATAGAVATSNNAAGCATIVVWTKSYVP